MLPILVQLDAWTVRVERLLSLRWHLFVQTAQLVRHQSMLQLLAPCAHKEKLPKHLGPQNALIARLASSPNLQEVVHVRCVQLERFFSKVILSAWTVQKDNMGEYLPHKECVMFGAIKLTPPSS